MREWGSVLRDGAVPPVGPSPLLLSAKVTGVDNKSSILGGGVGHESRRSDLPLLEKIGFDEHSVPSQWNLPDG